jgi:hypothetical protein
MREEREREREIPKREKQQILLQKCVLCKTFGPESTFSLHRFIKSCELWNYFGAVGWVFWEEIEEEEERELKLGACVWSSAVVVVVVVVVVKRKLLTLSSGLDCIRRFWCFVSQCGGGEKSDWFLLWVVFFCFGFVFHHCCLVWFFVCKFPLCMHFEDSLQFLFFGGAQIL